jgi:Mg2+ and Co2+ transporter CorA
MAADTVGAPPVPVELPRCHLIDQNGAVEFRFDRKAIEERLAADGFFWVDVHQPTEDELAVIRDGFGFHPLAVEDSEHFDQRPKVDDYDDFVFLVAYGANADEEFDDRIDQVEDAIFHSPSDECLQQVFAMKRFLVTLRKVITPQRDLFAGLFADVSQLPGMTAEDERYFRDVYDHMIRISDLVDSYRDLLTSAMDVYLSSVSNRLNVVMKQLAVIATIFLPLSFVVGFFGQNFRWMVGHISGPGTFFVLGIGTELVVLLAFVVMYKRSGWS